MRAYVQKHHGEFANINTLTAFLGFRDIGYDVRFFEFETINRLELGADTPVAGGIPVVLAALARLGILVPELPSIPSVLDLFAGRQVWTSTMQQARNLVAAGGTVFVKPVPADRKLFAGAVFREFRDTISTAHVPSE